MVRAAVGFDPAAMARLRRKRGLSFDALAALTGKSRRHLIGWEKAEMGPSPASLVTLADALGVKPWALTARSPGAADLTLAELRAWAGLRQEEVAAALGVSRPTYGKIEAGQRPLGPDDYALLRQLAAALGRPLGEVSRTVS